MPTAPPRPYRWGCVIAIAAVLGAPLVWLLWPVTKAAPVIVPIILAALLLLPTDAQLWAGYQAEARAALQDSDIVAIRCTKFGIPYPVEWRERDDTLRSIARAPTGDSSKPIPPEPAKPGYS